jgi:hypothetical protein
MSKVDPYSIANDDAFGGRKHESVRSRADRSMAAWRADADGYADELVSENID